MGRGSARRWLTGGSAAGLLGVALAIFVSGAAATHGENVFAGDWTTNTGSIRYQAVDPTTGSQAIVAQGGRTCAAPTVYYVGTYSDPGPHTGVASGCTVGGPNHLVGRYVGDPNTDAGAAGSIDINFVAPDKFSGTYRSDSATASAPYTATFAGHFTGDGCCPAAPPTTTTTTTTPPPGPPGASTEVFNLAVDPLFPITGQELSDRVATFQSSLGSGAFTASIDWGDGTPPSAGALSGPVKSGAAFGRSVSGTHTYAQSGNYSVRVTVTDPHGRTRSDVNQATVTACFCTTRPPVLGRTADIGPVSGRVFVKLPPGAKTARAAQAGKGSGFVPLTVPREIPVGSQIDTRQGQLVVMSATATSGRLSGGLFAGGIFQLLQNRREVGITELRLRSGSVRVCRTTGKARTAAAKRLSQRVLGLLRASVKGQYRTRGLYSSATVRGTQWTTTDRCDGTLTQVSRGAVTVFDFRKRRNIVVSAGRSYLARAR